MPHGRQTPSEADAQPRSGDAAMAAAALVALQGVGLLAVGVYLIVRVAQGGSRHGGSTALLGVLCLLAGAGMMLMARAVRRRRRRVRGPLLTLEIICLPIAITAIQGGRWYIGVPLGLVAIAVLVLLGLAGLLSPQE